MDDRVRHVVDALKRELAELDALIPQRPLIQRVTPGMDVQYLINTTPPELPLVFAPGEYGPIVLPPHASPTPRILRLETPLPDGRLQVGAQPLAHFRSPTAESAITVVGDWYILQGLQGSCAKPDGDIVRIGSATATRVEDQPDVILLDRCYFPGDRVLGQKRGIALHGRQVGILRCVITDCKRDGQDGQAVYLCNGPGPYVIIDNFLEASGENILIGGDSVRIPGLIPSDILIAGNSLYKPLSWMTQTWDVKNSLELKIGRRVTIRQNIIDGCWKQNQTGHAVLFTVKNQNGDNPWTVIEDVLCEDNLLVNVASGFNISGYDSDGQVSERAARLTIRNNLVVADRLKFGGDGQFMKIGNGPQGLVVESNTAIVNGSSPIQVYGGMPYGSSPDSAFRHNLLLHGAYGLKGDGTATGTPTLARYFPGVIWEGMVLAGGIASRYPVGTRCPTVEAFTAGFLDYDAGDYTVRPEGPWAGSGCDVTRLPKGR